MTLSELPAWAGDMLANARVAHLGLLDDRDRPRVLPVTFVLHEGMLYSAVDEKPKRVPAEAVARVRYIQRRPQAALTVDRYDEDWTRLAWVQVLCDARVVEREAAPGGLGALCQKYAPYRRRPPSGPVLELVPRRALCWRAAG
jgi:PPOX class probable F420-dependent enzyme